MMWSLMRLFRKPSMDRVEEAHRKFLKTTNRSMAAARLSSGLARKVLQQTRRVEVVASQAVKEIREE